MRFVSLLVIKTVVLVTSARYPRDQWQMIGWRDANHWKVMGSNPGARKYFFSREVSVKVYMYDRHA